MSKAAIDYSALLALAKKHKIGNSDAVAWEAFLTDAKSVLYLFTGVGRNNSLQPIITQAERNINGSNRYCHTRGELAALMGVSRNTLYRWVNGGLVTLKEAKPQRKFKGKVMYDAMDLLSQLKRNDR